MGACARTAPISAGTALSIEASEEPRISHSQIVSYGAQDRPDAADQVDDQQATAVLPYPSDVCVKEQEGDGQRDDIAPDEIVDRCIQGDDVQVG